MCLIWDFKLLAALLWMNRTITSVTAWEKTPNNREITALIEGKFQTDQ